MLIAPRATVAMKRITAASERQRNIDFDAILCDFWRILIQGSRVEMSLGVARARASMPIFLSDEVGETGQFN
jgi:hypothetical protein